MTERAMRRRCVIRARRTISSLGCIAILGPRFAFAQEPVPAPPPPPALPPILPPAPPATDSAPPAVPTPPAAVAKAPAPADRPKAAEPFAFGDFTWLNGSNRQHKAILDTPYFTPSSSST
jgi:hypothetical protein